MRVKVFNDELAKELLEGRKQKVEPKILTSHYVTQLNRGISYRIRQMEAARDVGKAEHILIRARKKD